MTLSIMTLSIRIAGITTLGIMTLTMKRLIITVLVQYAELNSNFITTDIIMTLSMT
jgi:hypothetical protein